MAAIQQQFGGDASLLEALGGTPERGDRDRGVVGGFLGCEDAVEVLLNSAAAAVSSQVQCVFFCASRCSLVGVYVGGWAMTCMSVSEGWYRESESECVFERS